MPEITLHDAEVAVLASLIHPETAKAAKAAAKKAHFVPREMFTIPIVSEAFDAFLLEGEAVLGGQIDGTRIEDVATRRIEPFLSYIVKNYRRKLAATDRTLDSFETPGKDSDDPDCLFQNRWLRRGMCGAIISTSGVGKSSFSIQAAMAWGSGQECLGVRPLHPLKIGIFQSEDDEYDIANFRDRIRLGFAADLDWTPEQIQAAERQVTFCALDGSTGKRFVEWVRRKQLEHHFDLIIINPLFAFFGSDLNDGSSMTAFLRHGIDPLIKDEETKCGMIIIHHTGKPNKEALGQGDVFKAYLGSGSGEFTNYVRSALVITPWNGGKAPGVFDLIAAKHGDKLGWRDADGKPTAKKTVCYANRLPEYQERGMIYWVEPDEVQLAELKKAAAPAQKAKVPPIEKCAQILAELMRTVWTETSRPANADYGQRRWAEKSRQVKSATKCSQTTNLAAYNLIATNPARFGLREFKNGRSAYFVSADKPTPETPSEDVINPEQELLF